MPKATEAQRKAFGQALAEALRDKAIHLDAGLRTDEWLAREIGLSSQAVRNYLSGIREPNRGRVILIETVLDLDRNELGRHLGIGVSDSERLDQLEDRVAKMADDLQQALTLLRTLAPQATRPRSPRSRAGRSGS